MSQKGTESNIYFVSLFTKATNKGYKKCVSKRINGFNNVNKSHPFDRVNKFCKTGAVKCETDAPYKLWNRMDLYISF